MKVKIEKAGPCRRLLKVELPAAQAEAEYAKVIAAWSSAAALPGFRKGKAPAALVERHYAKDIEEEVKERLVALSYRQALEQEKLEPLAILNVESTLTRGQPMTYQVTLDVPPEFKLPKYKGLYLKDGPTAVTDEQVQQRLDLRLDQAARYEPAPERPVQKDDLAQIDYQGSYAGKSLATFDKSAAGLGQGKDFWVMVNENAFLPGFDAGLLGMSLGERKEITVVFPNDFKIKPLAGQSAVYEVVLKAIREKKRPALDETLFKAWQVDSEAALREQLRQELQAEAHRRERARLKDEVCRLHLSKTPFDLPVTVVQEETRVMFASLVREQLMQGLTREQVAGQRDQLLTAAERSATEKVKLGYILHRIAEEEKITVADADLEAELQQMATRYRMPLEELRKTLTEKKELDAIRHEMRMHKTLDMILENAKIGEDPGFFKRLIGA